MASRKKVALARARKQAPPAEPADSLDALEKDASIISGLAGVVQAQIDEYTSLLDDIVEKVTGRSLWAPCSLAAAGGDHQTLNRKSGAIGYLLIMMGNKAEALEMRARTLHHSPKAAA